MRIRVLLLCLLILLSAGCGSKRKDLDSIEELLVGSPEEALYQLDSLGTGTLVTKLDRARYSLMLSEALDRCRIDLQTDSIIRPAISYYSKRGNSIYKVKAYYYYAAILKNQGNTLAAVINYDKALALAQEIRAYHYIGLISRALCWIYGEYYDFPKAEEYINKSIDAFRLDDYYYEGWSQVLKSQILMSLRQFDAANALLDSLIDAWKDNSVLSQELYRNKAALQMLTDPFDAEASLFYYEKVTSGLTVDDIGNKANAYLAVGQTDSAIYYLNLLDSNIVTADDRARGYFDKYRYYSQKREMDLAEQFILSSIEVQDSLNEHALYESMSSAISRHYEKEALDRNVHLKSRLRFYLLLLLTLLLVVIVLSQKLKLERGKVLRNMEMLDEVRSNITSLSEDRRYFSQAVSNLIKSRLEALNSIAQSYGEMESDLSKASDRRGLLMTWAEELRYKENLISKFKSALLALREEPGLYSGIEEGIDAAHDGIFSSLRKEFGGRFSEEDYRILSLIFLGVSDKAVAYLIGSSVATFRTRKSRYKTKIRESGAALAGQYLEFFSK